MAARTRILPIALPGDYYRSLEEIAREEERDPLQQARVMLKRALESNQPDQPNIARAGGT